MNSKYFQKILAIFNLIFASNKINHKLISDNALTVIDNLKKNNFEAYIVGGAIRDILMHKVPKDFDIATNATPEQIKSIFRRSMIIGRRFRLVHVIFGRQIIEVSTFRTSPTQKIQMSNGVLKDNEFGTIRQDAARRDFTINALYYNPYNKKIIDFYSGLKDIKNKKINLIGDPKTRFKEDPIRILRAIRFSVKLKIKISEKNKIQIKNSLPLLNEVPYSRLFDELMKFFFTGHALDSLAIFKEYNLSSIYFPVLDKLEEQEEIFLKKVLKDTDQRVLENKSTNPGFVLSVFLWHDVLSFWEENNKEKYAHPSLGLNDAIHQTMAKQNKIFAIQKRYCTSMSEIWRLQIRFNNTSKNKIYRLLGHPRFRAAYDFMLLRPKIEIDDNEMASWWTNFIDADEPTKQKLIINKSKKKHG